MVEKQGFRTACLTTGQKFQRAGLKLMAFILTFRDPSSHLCQRIMRMAERGDFDFWSYLIVQTSCFLLEFGAPGWTFAKLNSLREFEKCDLDMFPKSQI